MVAASSRQIYKIQKVAYGIETGKEYWENGEILLKTGSENPNRPPTRYWRLREALHHNIRDLEPPWRAHGGPT